MLKRLFLILLIYFLSEAQCKLVEIDSDSERIEGSSQKRKAQSQNYAETQDKKHVQNESVLDKEGKNLKEFIDDELRQIEGEDASKGQAETNNVVEVNIKSGPKPKVYQETKSNTAVEIKSAVIQFVNKNSAVHEHKKLNIGEEYEFERLKVILKKCFVTAPGEPICITAFLEIFELIGDSEASKSNRNYKKIFSGWMFSSKPSANTLENSNYDVKVENDANI